MKERDVKKYEGNYQKNEMVRQNGNLKQSTNETITTVNRLVNDPVKTKVPVEFSFRHICKTYRTPA